MNFEQAYDAVQDIKNELKEQALAAVDRGKPDAGLVQALKNIDKLDKYFDGLDRDRERTNIMMIAMEAGFALSTAYGQDVNKLMPISDISTLQTFAKKLLEVK